MTKKQFLSTLAQSHRRWEILPCGWIRTAPGQPYYCPITAVYEMTFPTGDYMPVGWYREAARQLGLTERVTETLSDAADQESVARPSARKQLLAALKL